jgi:cell division protein FtsA
MYPTCIGLILKGYNVYENNYNRLHPEEKRPLIKPLHSTSTTEEGDVVLEAVPVKGRKTLSDFMNSIKDGLIDLFKEEDDKQLL